MSCLFNSLSYFVSENSSELRQKICNYLESNPNLMDNMSASQVIYFENGQNLKDYINNMRSTSTWGGAIEIKCFCNIYNKNVFVRNIRDHTSSIIEFIINPKIIKNRFNCDENNFHITWSGGHYEPVRNI